MYSGVRFRGLADWLEWQQNFHPKAIDPGLDRVRRVLARTGWAEPSCPVITVGGTNGKGSCVAIIESILLAAGYRVASFTSPHLVDYRERIRLDGRMVSEASLISAFERITDALGPDSLSYFEFNALAALLIFESFAPDAIILEVGMGGRLDAVNVVDASVSIVTSIAVDHEQWLGADIESIAFEKAGIFRAGQPAIFGASPAPEMIRSEAERVGAKLLLRGREFDAIENGDGGWDFYCGQVRLSRLPLPGIEGAAQTGNAATALAGLHELRDGLPMERSAIVQGLQTAVLPGRYQRVPDQHGFEWVLDVAHNPHAALALAASLDANPVAGRTIGICGFLDDKDIERIMRNLANSLDAWVAVTIGGERGLTDAELVKRAERAGFALAAGGTVEQAMSAAAERAEAGDRLAVFGSFHVVGPALRWLRARGLIIRQ